VPPKLKALVAVFIGGLVGSAARFGIDLTVTSVVGDEWYPYGILIINMTGSFLMGLLVGHGLSSWPVWLQTGATVGVLGSFTTLSAISLDVAVPIVGHGVMGFAVMAPYAIGSVVLGVVSAVWGLRVGKSLRGAAT
jgi:CrcB protein